MATPVSVSDKAYPFGNPTILHRLAVVTGIDLKTVSTPTLYTPPAGFNAIITEVVLEATNVVGFSVAAAAGVGVAAGEADVMGSVTLTSLDSTGDIWPFTNANVVSRTVPSGSPLKLGIDTGATATTFTVSAHVYGILVPT